LYRTKSGWRCIGRFPLVLANNLHNPPANGKQGPIPKEIYHTLLTNKSKETWIKYTPLTLLRQSKLALTARNTLFAL
jgi:hypothetical protein